MVKKEEVSTSYPLDPLVRIMQMLRSDTGCPWDREQTHGSLKKHLIEETYEVVAAIEAADMYSLREELGDLLLQIVFHSQLAAEKQEFDLNDVIGDIVAKLERRHPHIFGEPKEISAEEVATDWEEIKRQERKEADKEQKSMEVARSLPALLRAEKIQAKAALIGFDWPDIWGAWSKIREEALELREAVREEETDGIKEELGDLLFAIVNVARFLKVDPEAALGQTCDKFINRFDLMEKRADELGLELETLDLAEMDNLWKEIKRKKS